MASLQHSASIPVRSFGEREAPIRDAAALLASLRHLVEPDEIGLDVHPLDALPPLSLDAAYRHCVEITRINSRSFYLSSQLLPFEKRMAIRALYAFCRTSDDTVDRRLTIRRARWRNGWRVCMRRIPRRSSGAAGVGRYRATVCHPAISCR
jgi:phytoene synthase